MYKTTDFFGDSNIGLYGFATNKYCLIGGKNKKFEKHARCLDVNVVHAPVLNTWLAGIFIAGNSSGVVISSVLEDDEIKVMKKHIKNVLVLDTYHTAMGNLVVMNDNGIILSPLLKKFMPRVESFFGIPCSVSKIALSAVIGKLAVATNKGCLMHPGAAESEKKLFEKTLRVPVAAGTISYGSPYVGSGLIANDSGFVASRITSGHELGNIVEALGFL